MIRFFRYNQLAAAALIALLTAAIWMFGFLSPVAVNVKNTMPLYEICCNLLGTNLIVQYIVAILLLLTQSFYFNYIVNKHELLWKASYIPALIYALFMSICKAYLMLHPLLFCNFFILIAVHKMLGTYRKEEAFGNIFDAGLYISIASLFYFPAIVLFPLVWVCLLVIRPFVWREWIISFLGFIVPYLFAFTYYFWLDKVGFFLFDKIFFPVSDSKFSIASEPTSFIILVTTLLFVIAVSFIKLLNGLPVNTAFSGNVFLFFLWMIGLSFVSFFMAPILKFNYLAIAAMPIAVYVANYFLNTQRLRLAEILFWIFLITIFYNQYVYYIKPV